MDGCLTLRLHLVVPLCCPMNTDHKLAYTDSDWKSYPMFDSAQTIYGIRRDRSGKPVARPVNYYSEIIIDNLLRTLIKGFWGDIELVVPMQFERQKLLS